MGLKYIKTDLLTRTGTINLSLLPHCIHTRSRTQLVAQSPIQALPCSVDGRSFSWGVKCPMRDLTTHLHLVLRLRMTGAVSPLPNMPQWPARRQLHFTYSFLCLVTSATSEFIRALLLRISLFWDMKPCRLVYRPEYSSDYHCTPKMEARRSFQL